jgi:CRP/FNR family transcriptional regulator, polysaccharide utilization system transcription regulator
MKKEIEKIHCATCISREKSVFNNLPLAQLEEMNQAKTCQEFKKGEIIFKEGGIPHGVFCIHHGKIKLFKTGTEGKAQIIRFAKDGDLIGYRSLLCNESLNATAECLDDTTVCFIPKTTLLQMISSCGGLSMSIMKATCHELGEASRILTNLVQKNITERVAEVLLILKANFGLDEDKTIQVILTREDLANMVGTATESVIRVLSKFNADGLIELHGKNIRLIDIPELTRIARLEE